MNDLTIAPPREQSLLFADLVGSTRLYEILGDSEALRVVSVVVAKMESTVSAQQGRVVKTIGDEVMATFATPTEAAQAATAMMRGIEQGLPGVDLPLQLRIGFHHGPVLEAEGDVFGDTVNTAARLVRLAKPGQIMTSSAAVAHLSPHFKQMARNLERFSLKGKHEEFAVYELLWSEPENATILSGRETVAALLASLTAGAHLTLKHRQGSFTLSPARPTAHFGRAQDSDIVVDDQRVSRRHAKIELRRDKFVLVDESSNGTYVRFENRDEILLRREEMVLHGKGCFGLGNSTLDAAAATLVHFESA
ncbi:MAG: adenylate/guanylate cyclase domain-containing protein [Methylococcaceae bacterium]|nr:MAG: adenylate/guanylate cyclase domain-containing protein [Methylococcaceae bacterium]